MEHRHHGKSSIGFLDSDEILAELNLEGNKTFVDAGCGDGHIAVKVAREYIPNGMVYAVDIHAPSIDELNQLKEEESIDNLICVEADIAKGIAGVEDSAADVVLMLNVFHGFDPSDEMDDVVEELKRITVGGGKIAIMDFKPIEMTKGPPIEIRKSPKELEEIFARHGLKKAYLNEEIGEDISEGKSHYMIIFKKE